MRGGTIADPRHSCGARRRSSACHPHREAGLGGSTAMGRRSKASGLGRHSRRQLPVRDGAAIAPLVAHPVNKAAGGRVPRHKPASYRWLGRGGSKARDRFRAKGPMSRDDAWPGRGVPAAVATIAPLPISGCRLPAGPRKSAAELGIFECGNARRPPVDHHRPGWLGVARISISIRIPHQRPALAPASALASAAGSSASDGSPVANYSTAAGTAAARIA